MRRFFTLTPICFWALLSAVLQGQVTLNQNPSRSLGLPRMSLTGLAPATPNLVEGRELNQPQGIALDSRSSPAALYISDTGNNRVLAWRDARNFANGAFADVVIGQRDFFSTAASGPGTSQSTGLRSPTGLAVDSNGNLYVVDSGNNRILRFPMPMSQSEQIPDLVIGQTTMGSREPNAGGISERTIATSTGSTYLGFLAFDDARNLFFADPANHRVLRYPASSLGAGASFGPSADLVLGQPDFLSNTPLAATSENRLLKTGLNAPSGVALDSAGRLFVSDSMYRVLVFLPPFSNGKAAERILGIATQVQGQPPLPTTNDMGLVAPEGVLMVGSFPAVADAGNSRVVLYDPYEQWPSQATLFSPKMRSGGVIGQMDLFNGKVNRGLPEPNSSTLSIPVAAAFSGDELYVVDSGNNRVLVFPQQSPGGFSAATRVLGQDRFEGSSPNYIEGREFRFTLLTQSGTAVDGGIVVDTTSSPPHLYVADTYNHRVLGFRDVRNLKLGQKADLVIGQPDFHRSLINYPNNDPARPSASSLFRPIGLAVDRDGNLWVADTGNSRVLRFPKPFAQSQTTLQSADLVLGQSNFTTKITDATSRNMSAPYGLAFSGDSGLMVSDNSHNRVLFFLGDPNTYTNGMAAWKVFCQPDFSTTTAGSTDNRVNSPSHIGSDSDGRLYVVDTGNGRVLIFNDPKQAGTDPRPSITLRNTFPNQSTLYFPKGIFVSLLTGEIWVTDSNNGRALRYPRFNDLILSTYATSGVLDPAAPVAVTLDASGNLILLDAANRLAFYYQGMVALNAANSLVGRALAPGTWASAYPLGGLFGPDTKVFNELPNPIPMPTELADTQLFVNDTLAPLYVVSPTQINFLVPMKAPQSGTADLTVIRPSTGEILAAGPVDMTVASPALFTQAMAPSGQVAAVNEDGTLNSATNPIQRGKWVSLYLTGQGFVPNAPPDGVPPTEPVNLPFQTRVIVNTGFLQDSDILYSGLAPGSVSLWQINIRIPMTVPPSNNILVVVQYRDIPSNNPSSPSQIRTTIAVKQ